MCIRDSADAGDRVFVAPNYGCGRCRACRRGEVNLCETPRAIGITEDGAFAEYVLLPRDLVAQGNLLPSREDADPGAVALAEPLACALRGSRACRIGEGAAHVRGAALDARRVRLQRARLEVEREGERVQQC